MRFFTRIFPMIFSLLILLPLSGFSQSERGICGTSDYADTERYMKNIQAARNGIVKERGAITYVPVKYISGARTNGSGRVSDAAILDMHCHLNEIYADQEIQFYIKDGEFKYIDSDAFFDDHRGTEGLLMNSRADGNAVNVFIVRDISNPGGTAGQILGYYTPARDWLVIRTNQVNSTSQTLAHEIGHFFSVQHPHFGWEPDPFGPGDTGWPTAPSFSPGGAPTEFADGSNCLTAGDMLCDTPADYNGLETSGCVYNNGAKDPNGVEIDPDETLIMSYFDDDCVTRFTDDQKDLILADLASAARNKLNIGSYTPPSTTVSSNIWINSPQNSVPFSGGIVTVDWADAQGATHYVFELATNPFFQNSPLTFFTDESSIELTDIDPGKKYYYRIKPYNQVVTCAPTSRTFSFQTTASSVSSADEISFVKNFSVFPNPAERNAPFFISVVSKEIFEGEVSVYDLTGKEIHRESREFKAGDNQFPVEITSDLSGVYVLFIKTDAGVLKRKFVVTQ